MRWQGGRRGGNIDDRRGVGGGAMAGGGIGVVILAAIGYAGIADLDVDGVKVWLDDVLVAENGGRAAAYKEADGARVMAQAEITVRVDLGRGAARANIYTCDFSYDYVKINAEYTT